MIEEERWVPSVIDYDQFSNEITSHSINHNHPLFPSVRLTSIYKDLKLVEEKYIYTSDEEEKFIDLEKWKNFLLSFVLVCFFFILI